MFWSFLKLSTLRLHLALFSNWYCSYPNFALQTKQGLTRRAGCFLHLSILPSVKPLVTKAALHVRLGRARAHGKCKSCSFWCCNFNQVHTRRACCRRQGLTSVLVADVPVPVLRSGLISQTPLLSIRSELVWREMSLCCELQMLSGSVCRSGIEWGSGERVRAWDGGRTRGGRADGVGSFLFFKWHCSDRKKRSTVLSVEGWGQLWPVRMSDGGIIQEFVNRCQGSLRNKAHTLTLTFSSRSSFCVSRKRPVLGEMADGRPRTLAHCQIEILRRLCSLSARLITATSWFQNRKPEANRRTPRWFDSKTRNDQ